MTTFRVICTYLISALFCQDLATPAEDRALLKPFLNKKYQLETSDDNWEPLMVALGVNYFKRKMGHLATPTMELRDNNGSYTLAIESVFKNTYANFRFDEEFIEETADDRVVKSIITQDKNKLIHHQGGDVPVLIVREFTPDRVTVKYKVKDIESVRTCTPV